MRYSDEGDTEEYVQVFSLLESRRVVLLTFVFFFLFGRLCRWTVDLSGLPSFQENMQRGSFGFYTEFDLGLELDSGEFESRAKTRREDAR